MKKNLKVIPKKTQRVFRSRELFLSNFADAHFSSKRQPPIIVITKNNNNGIEQKKYFVFSLDFSSTY